MLAADQKYILIEFVIFCRITLNYQVLMETYMVHPYGVISCEDVCL